VAKFLEQESNIKAGLDPKGKIGELTVWVDDKLVVTKGFFIFPSKESILKAVTAEL